MLSALDAGADVERPATAVVQVVGDIEIYLAGLIDPAKERERLSAKRVKLLEDAAKAEARLSNQDFVKRAPADVVDKERKKLKELRAQIALLEANLRPLQS